MNTDGHHGVADDAGIPLLKGAFGKDSRSINAFYLGNWLTDVSQAVDPVAYAAGSGTLTKGAATILDSVADRVDTIVDELLTTLYDKADIENDSLGDRILENLHDKLNLAPYADAAKKAMKASLDFFVAGRVQERDSHLGAFLRNVFLIIGYYKFVHPEFSGAAPRMDFEVFMRVFGRASDTHGASGGDPAADRPGAYTQYYPHEHLDRPELFPSEDPPVFSPGRQIPSQAYHIATGSPAPGTRSRSNSEHLDPDLYSYLRDQMEMTAGLLAEIDLDFKKALEDGFRDSDPAWNVTLAKLGHALHQVEDFFAHSNWVELAASRLGEDFLDKAIPPPVGNDLIDRARTQYHMRRRRHLTEPFEDWRSHPPEDWVVTGYFDFRDTAISLAHMAEEALGYKVPDPYASAHDLWEMAEDAYEKPETVEAKARELLRHTLDFLTNPEAAVEDRDNTIAQWLKEEFEPDIKKMVRPGVSTQVGEKLAKEIPSLQAAPAVVRDAFLNVVIEGSRTITIAKTTMSLYSAWRSITSFFANPARLILNYIPGHLHGKVRDAMKFYVKERFYDAAGADRIGCHSLLAKDHGSEPLYKYQRLCSTAVHWYIVRTLLRWNPANLSADAQPPTYIDWLELLEFYLRNPLPPTGSFQPTKTTVAVCLPYTTAKGDRLDAVEDQYSLAKRFRKSAANPARFTWRTIADANFGTGSLPLKQAQTVINSTLRDKAWGYKVKHPNYAFKAGVALQIPDQKVVVDTWGPVVDDPRWFTDVMTEEDWRVFRGRELELEQASEGPREYHKPVSISRDRFEELILRGRKLRREARAAYRPQ